MGGEMHSSELGNRTSAAEESAEVISPGNRSKGRENKRTVMSGTNRRQTGENTLD
jgi:hypothetical protein